MTKREYEVMELLWKSNRPLSCSEIVAISENKTWKDSYVHSLIKSLMKKGIVKIESFELISRSYARKFAPALSKSEYAAQLLAEFLTTEEVKQTVRILKKNRELVNDTDGVMLINKGLDREALLDEMQCYCDTEYYL